MEIVIEKMCRTCLSTGPALITLFESPETSLKSNGVCSIGDMLKSFTSIEAVEGDGLPPNVCISCIGDINRAYSFKIKCESSDLTLKKLFAAADTETIINSNVVLNKSLPPKKNDLTTESSDSYIKELIIQPLKCEDYNVTENNEDVIENSKDIIENSDLQNEDNSDDEKSNNYIYEIEQENENSLDDKMDVIVACGVCMQAFDTNDSYLKHTIECFKKNHKKDTKPKEKPEKKLIQCSYCPIDFVHQKNLDKHIDKYHKNNANDDCNLSSNGEESNIPSEEVEEVILVQKIPKPAISAQFPFSCSECGAGFSKEKSLSAHKKLKKCTMPQHECNHCKRVFITNVQLLEHLKIHRKPHLCKKCGESFATQEDLKAHVSQIHPNLLKNQCNICGKVFTMASTLKDHMRIHSGERPFVCNFCGKGFNQATNLKQHKMRHTKTKPFKCPECNYSFVSKGELNAHILAHTGHHPFVCKTCGSKFTTSSSLVKHRRIHTGERPYACEFCPMRFAALSTLKNHRRTHTGERPYSCTYCDRRFTQKSDCNTHMRSHTSEKPYMCQICGIGFQQLGVLKNHIKTHESNENYKNTNNSGGKRMCEADGSEKERNTKNNKIMD